VNLQTATGANGGPPPNIPKLSAPSGYPEPSWNPPSKYRLLGKPPAPPEPPVDKPLVDDPEGPLESRALVAGPDKKRPSITQKFRNGIITVSAQSYSIVTRTAARVRSYFYENEDEIDDAEPSDTWNDLIEYVQDDLSKIWRNDPVRATVEQPRPDITGSIRDKVMPGHRFSEVRPRNTRNAWLMR
jgi:hypothetical protein